MTDSFNLDKCLPALHTVSKLNQVATIKSFCHFTSFHLFSSSNMFPDIFTKLFGEAGNESLGCFQQLTSAIDFLLRLLRETSNNSSTLQKT